MGRMIQEPLAWQPELSAGEGLGADPPECHPTAPAGNQGGCWGVGKLCRGMGTAGGPGGLLRASVGLFRGVGVVGHLGEGVVWKVRGQGWNWESA